MSSLFVRFKNDIEKEVNRCLVPLMISFEEIESATDNFADRNYIGQDSTGKFYRGQLLQSGKMIDILVREFNEYKNRQNVIPTLLKHENIRGIINWTSINEGRDRVFFFAYKIEANGSLAEHLPSTGLTWAQRLSICIGVGQALKHIHYSDFVKPGYYVIHGNINSSDIFLDDNWQPKLQGFKYAMVAERNTLLHVTSKYKCTLQYKDPSYEKTGALTDKSDVYSFGVVLFEVLFGRKADTPNGDDEDHWNFAEFARSHWKNKTLEDVMIDRDMRKSIDSQSFEIFSNVAYACLTEREERPNMEQVVRELEKSLQLQKNHEHSMATETSSRNLQGESFEHLRIPLKDIQSATEGFDSKYKIGSGGFATVYRAKLKHFQSKNSTTIESGDDDVAIKVISSTTNGFGEKGFIAEVKMLSKCKHPNIVSLLGFCDEGPQKILIYEYVPNGSLDGYLERSYRMTNLTWGRRLQICLDIARGLDYLHSGLNGNEIIIHRDIKSANILLDDNLRAKIADFGLSRLSIIGSKNSTINTYNIAGTDFYLDPAYQKTGDLKKASDIYSFGVVLFEILCGTLAYDKIHTTDTENGLPSIARRLFKEGKLKAIVDPSIKETDGSIFSRSRVADQNSLDTFLSIANQCLVETQKERPTIKEVIKELEKALSFQNNNQENLQVLLEDINLATQSFGDCNCIGEGKFWKLYKGEVPQAISNTKGCTAVVAKRWNKSGEGHQLFFRELEFVFKNKHETVTDLVGYCTEMEEKIIVYEYSSKGSLDKHLKDVTLTWMDRLKICLDVASGLEFLHSIGGPEEMMMHGDIKCCNILIDGDRKAKVFNFELIEQSNLELSAESDIYALGVLLLEVVSGRLVSEDPSKPLVPLATDGWSQELDEMVFEVIKDQIDPFSMSAFTETANMCFGKKKPKVGILVNQLKDALEYQKYIEDIPKVSIPDIKLGSDKCIQEGRYWKLYEAQISNANGWITVLAKCWDNTSREAHYLFLTELRILLKSNNKHVVACVGYCNEMNKKIIFYEHASNSSLDKYLDDASLTWKKRLNICIHVARGLQYLHESDVLKKGHIRLKHAALKSGSILLDGYWKAKIANLEYYPPAPLSDTVFNYGYGSPGYVEFGGNHRSTTDVDVYALGVVLLEMLCGRLAWPEGCEDHSQSLGPLAQRHLKEKRNLDELVFEGIKEQIDSKSLFVFLTIAFGCLEGQERPSARMVVQDLETTLKLQQYLEHIPQISLEDIIQGTLNFRDDKCVGKGIYWKLYEEVFLDAKTHLYKTALVKRWDSKSREARHGFFTELRVLYECWKYNNIIGVEGYINEMDEKIIVYKHGYNKSLDNHLNDASLSWTKRLKICINVASALNSFKDFSTGWGLAVHGDIRSGSILIDGEWNAKLSNFDLFSQMDDEPVPDNAYSSLGYGLPKHKASHNFTDIYAFGVVLMEILCGRLAWGEGCEDHSESLGPLAERHYKEKGNLDELVFEGIKGQIDPESLNAYQEIALQCIQESMHMQPDGQQIVEQLKNALELQQHLEHIPQLSLEGGTLDFRDDMCVGKDIYWTLFEGEFLDAKTHGYETALAKRWDSKSREACHGFFRELKILYEFREYNNIIAVEGYINETDEKIIVYEHGFNRSLVYHLNDASLSWTKRLKICINVASALNSFKDFSIGRGVAVHGDIRSGSILINGEWNAKLSNFDLFSQMDDEPVPDNADSSLGYGLPKHKGSHNFTDIYAFGVVLMEILCGRSAWGEGCEDHSESLGPFAKRHYKEKGNFDELVFEGIKGQIDPESLTAYQDIAVQCISESMHMQPSGQQIVEQLKNALELQKYVEENPQISLEDIKSATHNLSEENCIGEGRYWKLYEGHFPHAHANGYTTALVKRWDSKSSQGRQQFFRERRILAQFKMNENIVAVEGYCCEKDEKIIVFENAYNRSLDKHLDYTSLSWTKRLNISINVARVLYVLHNRDQRWQRPLIHGDIRSGSILIDGDWNAKVSNFELFARDGEEVTNNKAHISPGYVDPQHQGSGKYKDIYSLGVVLLEIMCGRLAWPEGCEDHSRSLGPLAQRHYKEKGNLDELVFEGIKEQIDAESLIAYQEIALKCLADTEDRQPIGREIEEQLKNALILQEEYELWKSKLPKEYKEYVQMSENPELYSTEGIKDLHNMLTKGILLQHGKLLFTLGTYGERNEMISAMTFSYKNRPSRIWQSISESRFRKVAQMWDISNLMIQIKIKTQFLSLGINYGVYLVFKFYRSRKSRAKREYVNLSYKRGEDNLHAYFATWRDDEWMMIELCRFSNDTKNAVFEAILKSFSRFYCGSRIIYVEGIEFRSIDNVNYEEIEKSKDVQQVSKSCSNIDNVQQLMNECQEIWKISGNDKEGEKIFNVDEVNVKKHLRLLPEKFLYDSCNMKPFDLNPSSASRFQGVEFLRQHVFCIKCKIESHVLSPDTDYMCYLVFKLSEKCNGLHGPVIIRNLLNRKNKEIRILYFRSPSSWNLHNTDWVPIARKDGWMEVTVWKFNSKSELRNDGVSMNLKLITYDGTMAGLMVCNLEIRPI